MQTKLTAMSRAIWPAIVGFALLASPTCKAQFLQNLMDRAKDAAQRATEDEASRSAREAVERGASASRTAVTSGAGASKAGAGDANAREASAPTTAPAPAASAAGQSSQSTLAPRLSLTAKLASGDRTQDFRKGVPPALGDRNLPDELVELANPYLPDDRRIFSVTAMAPHPEGGIIFWADGRHFSSNDDSEEFHGLWRMEADGRVTAFAVESEADFQRNRLHCDGPFDKIGLGRPDSLVVEPDGDVLAAGTSGVVVRIRRNGYVERIAGGGEKYCGDVLHGSDIGYRDGPGRQALFSDQLGIAQAKDGGIYVTERNPSRTNSLARIRHVDTHGVVTTIFTGQNCSGRTCPPSEVGVNSIAVDHDGTLLLTNARTISTSTGQEQSNYTVHRLDPATGKSNLIAFSVSMVATPGVPYSVINGVALLPDGRPIARADGGFILLDGPKPTFNYWVKWTEGRRDDGPIATTSLVGDSFCVATDGSIYMATYESVRRLDPKTRRVSTWLR